MTMRKPIKDMFLDIVEEWEGHWKEEVGFYDFLNEFIEIDDGLRTYVVKKIKKRPEFF